MFLVPSALRSIDLTRTAVRQNGLVLAELLAKDKTPDICREAVQQNREALNFVPFPLKKQIWAETSSDLDALLTNAKRRAAERNAQQSDNHQAHHTNRNKGRW